MAKSFQCLRSHRQNDVRTYPANGRGRIVRHRLIANVRIPGRFQTRSEILLGTLDPKRPSPTGARIVRYGWPSAGPLAVRDGLRILRRASGRVWPERRRYERLKLAGAEPRDQSALSSSDTGTNDQPSLASSSTSGSGSAWTNSRRGHFREPRTDSYVPTSSPHSPTPDGRLF
jgi:hypothetical protein